MGNSKGSANFLVKWEGAKQASTMNVVRPSRTTGVKELKNVKGLGQYKEDSSGRMALIAVFDCRGCEPIGWHPVGPFAVTSANENTWKEVDLSDALVGKDGWMEVDESGDPSTINELTFEFKPLK